MTRDPFNSTKAGMTRPSPVTAVRGASSLLGVDQALLERALVDITVPYVANSAGLVDEHYLRRVVYLQEDGKVAVCGGVLVVVREERVVGKVRLYGLEGLQDLRVVHTAGDVEQNGDGTSLADGSHVLLRSVLGGGQFGQKHRLHSAAHRLSG